MEAREAETRTHPSFILDEATRSIRIGDTIKPLSQIHWNIIATYVGMPEGEPLARTVHDMTGAPEDFPDYSEPHLKNIRYLEEFDAVREVIGDDLRSPKIFVNVGDGLYIMDANIKLIPKKEESDS